eukprot:TRINITY_DN13087_c0_g1_i1.p1 TRINITY_DN13087_c0_g1~~TRINITY_DN13087_c0_g1_i1.p1  ORF type:complete len:624 (+),score=186.29 TRINITY_DN13087_c0_g1_i1:169-1872(+)
MSIAKMLFDTEQEYSLVNKDPLSAQIWFNATYTKGGTSNKYYQSSVGTLQSVFNLTLTQIEMIVLQWLPSSFFPIIVDPVLLANGQAIDSGVETLSDLGWLQWSACKGTANNQTISSTSNSPYYMWKSDAIPEFGCYNTSISPLNVNNSKTLLNGTVGLFRPLDLAVYTAAIFELNNSTKAKRRIVLEFIEDTWGFDNEDQIDAFNLYFKYSSEFFSVPYLQELFNNLETGLFVKKKVNNWLFQFDDPLIGLLLPDDPGIADLQKNMSTVADAKKYPPSLLYTGKDDIDQVAHFINWGGITEIPYPKYAQNVSIEGFNSWGQFDPFMRQKNTEEFFIWDDNYLRSLKFEKVTEFIMEGIKLWRFQLSNSTHLPDPVYYQTIPGFTNMTSFNSGAPVFYSNPHFNGHVPNYYADKVIGCQEYASYRDFVTVDIEPTLGLTFHANETLQANVFLQSKELYDMTIFYQNVTTDIFYPLMWVYETAEFDSTNRDQYFSQVGLMKWLMKASFGFFIFLSCLSFSACFILMFYIIKRTKTSSLPNTEPTLQIQESKLEDNIIFKDIDYDEDYD